MEEVCVELKNHKVIQNRTYCPASNDLPTLEQQQNELLCIPTLGFRQLRNALPRSGNELIRFIIANFSTNAVNSDQ